MDDFFLEDTVLVFESLRRVVFFRFAFFFLSILMGKEEVLKKRRAKCVDLTELLAEFDALGTVDLF